MEESRESKWQPNPEFIDFMAEKFDPGPIFSGDQNTVTGAQLIQEAREGTERGRQFYESQRLNPEINEQFERWKTSNS